MTLHAATKKPPEEMLMVRQLRTALDILRPERQEKRLDEYRELTKKQYDKTARQRIFEQGIKCIYGTIPEVKRSGYPE